VIGNSIRGASLHPVVSMALLFVVFGGLAMVVSGCASPGNGQSREADIAELRCFLETAGEAVNKGDVEGEVNRFTEDGIYMWPDAPSIEGHAALREWFERRFAQVEAYLESETKELEVCGDWAFERGTYVARIQPKSGNEVSTVHGKYVNILRRLPDGSWKIARRIRNRDHPAG
jgi:ketosteroid isomerase-like protein